MKFLVLKQAKRHSQVENAIKVAKKYNSTLSGIKQTNTMYCPYCGAPLEATSRKENLETLDEHVSCSEVTSKTVYKCSAHCKESELTMWSYNGESYLDTPKGISDEEWESFYKLNREYNKIFGNAFPTALNTTALYSEASTYAYGKKKDICILKYPWNKKKQLWLEKRYEADGFGYLKYFRIHWELRIYDKPGCYYLGNVLINDILRLKRNVRISWNKFKKDPTERNIKALYGNSRFYKPEKWNIVEKIWFKYCAPLVFGKLMGIKNIHEEKK